MAINFNNLSAVSFKMNIKRLPEMDYRIQSANIPGVSLGAIDVPTPFTKIPVPGNLAFDDLSVSFLVSESMTDYYSVYKWMMDLGQPEQLGTFPPNLTDAYSDVSLIVLSNSSNPIADVKFIDAYPIGLSPLQFDVTQAGVQLITATVTFRYRWFDFNFIIA